MKLSYAANKDIFMLYILLTNAACNKENEACNSCPLWSKFETTNSSV